MSTTLMIDHRVYIHSPITGVMCGLHAMCGSCDSAVYSFLEPGPTRGPATAGLTADSHRSKVQITLGVGATHTAEI